MRRGHRPHSIVGPADPLRRRHGRSIAISAAPHQTHPDTRTRSSSSGPLCEPGQRVRSGGAQPLTSSRGGPGLCGWRHAAAARPARRASADFDRVASGGELGSVAPSGARRSRRRECIREELAGRACGCRELGRGLSAGRQRCSEGYTRRSKDPLSPARPLMFCFTRAREYQMTPNLARAGRPCAHRPLNSLRRYLHGLRSSERHHGDRRQSHLRARRRVRGSPQPYYSRRS
jgi:hypothetical protein